MKKQLWENVEAKWKLILPPLHNVVGGFYCRWQAMFAWVRIKIHLLFVSFPHVETSLGNCWSLTEPDASETWRSVFVFIRLTHETLPSLGTIHTFLFIETKAQWSCLIVGWSSDLGVWACEIHLGLYRIPSSLQTSKCLTRHLQDVGIFLSYFVFSNNVIDL